MVFPIPEIYHREWFDRILFLYSNGPNLYSLKKIPLILIMFFLAVYPACEGEGICTQSVLSVVNAGFYSWDGEEEIDVFLDDFSLCGEGKDSLLYDHKNSVSSFSFPMDMNALSSTLILQAGSLLDTLVIQYAVVPVLISYECGFTNTFEMDALSYTGHFIDSVSMINNIANVEDEENLKIFL